MSPDAFPSLPVLLVDDEAQALHSLELALRSAGVTNIISCRESQQVLPLLAEKEIELLLLDLWMPHVSGEELLAAATAEFPDLPVIVVTGVNEVVTAVRCMKSGAFEYLVKPVDKERLLTAVGRAIEIRDLRRENLSLARSLLSTDLEHPEAFAAIVTRNEAMRSIFQYVEAIARTAQPVLITGETGVGKELIARAVHALSDRKGSFVAVDVAGLDDTVFADALFGHRKGAFTGAEEPRVGLVEQAAGGTLFLDEIGDLSGASQVKLLRLLQEREYRPLGSDMPKRADVRVVVATNRDLVRAQQSGRIRKDLYYRLSTHQVQLPPLRERLDDLPLLVDHFLDQAARELKRKRPTPPKELLALLAAHPFPGNVRELRSMVFDAVGSHRSRMLSLQRFKAAIDRTGSSHAADPRPLPERPGEGIRFSQQLPTLREAERAVIAEALKRAQGNQSVAARMVGITRQALNRRLRRGDG
jgi:two-component system, NtrC family, nitrogen regulation response regulator GlnG